MSRRGGGRHSDSRRDQSSPSPAQSFQRGGRGGDGGRGREGRGRGGRGRGYVTGAGSTSGFEPASASPPAAAPPPAYPPAPASVPPPATVRPVAAPPSASSVPPASASASASSSASSSTVPPQSAEQSSVSMLSREVEQRLKLAPASSMMKKFPARPGFGKIGRKCVVRANHFLVEVANRDLHHYDVTINPEVTSKKVNRDVITELVNMYRVSHLGQRTPAYDGRKSLYTAGPLPFNSKEFVVKLDDKDAKAGPSASNRKERQFKVAIKLASTVDLNHLQEFLQMRQMDAPQEVIQALDVVLRESPSKEYVVVGRSFFSLNLGPKGELGDGAEYWRGYYQSLRLTQMGLSLNIDVSARPFYEQILVTDFAAKYLYIRDLSRPLSDQDRAKLKKVLKSLKVELSHMDYVRRYKITGISNQPIGKLMFTLDDKKTNTSVVQYFRDRYNISLNYTSLPALLAGSESKPVYLPMELCRIAEKQRYTRKLNERQVTSMLRATCQRPRDRETNVKQIVRQMVRDDDKNKLVRNEFGIQVREEPSLVDARVLPPPMLKYHDTGREVRVDPQLGQWNMINKKMINGGKVEYWTCVNFSTRLDRSLPSEFCRQLVEMCNSKGMEFNQNPILPICSYQPSQIERVLTDINRQSMAKLQGIAGKRLQLLIIILPDISGSYGKIKRVCETELGIVSQCCQPRQASKLSKQYFENVALKINVKVGGRNTVLNDAIQKRLPLVTDRPTIIFGADVTHPQAGEDSGPSIAAVVASMDWPEITKYRGIVSAQPHREEIIQDLYKRIQDPQKGLVHSGMIRELLIAFRRSTGWKPHRIIFYRDGVSEGQFSHVLLYEMDAIWKACNSLEEGYLPTVTFVVVQKRHHTRLFPADHSKRDLTDRSGNILPGTVVETNICHPTEFDFYLNSHAGIQGTSRPTHYHVLYDDNHFTADGLQVLTNSLCYTYARCTRSVSIVPPAYYAHLAAFRARYYIEGETSDGGSTGGKNMEVRPLPAIKENVKDVMFYC